MYSAVPGRGNIPAGFLHKGYKQDRLQWEHTAVSQITSPLIDFRHRFRDL